MGWRARVASVCCDGCRGPGDESSAAASMHCCWRQAVTLAPGCCWAVRDPRPARPPVVPLPWAARWGGGGCRRLRWQQAGAASSRCCPPGRTRQHLVPARWEYWKDAPPVPGGCGRQGGGAGGLAESSPGSAGQGVGAGRGGGAHVVAGVVQGGHAAQLDDPAAQCKDCDDDEEGGPGACHGDDRLMPASEASTTPTTTLTDQQPQIVSPDTSDGALLMPCHRCIFLRCLQLLRAGWDGVQPQSTQMRMLPAVRVEAWAAVGELGHSMRSSRNPSGLIVHPIKPGGARSHLLGVCGA